MIKLQVLWLSGQENHRQPVAPAALQSRATAWTDTSFSNVNPDLWPLNRQQDAQKCSFIFYDSTVYIDSTYFILACRMGVVTWSWSAHLSGFCARCNPPRFLIQTSTQSALTWATSGAEGFVTFGSLPSCSGTLRWEESCCEPLTLEATTPLLPTMTLQYMFI